jgi:hypothetical protein
MLAKRCLALLAAAVIAVLCATCAPVGPAGPEKTPTATERPTDKDEPVKLPGRDILRERIELALKNVRDRDLRSDFGFWTVFHGILGLGPKDAFLTDPLTGKRVNAIDYICNGGEVRGMEFPETKHGLDVKTAVGELVFVGQGHQDQFIAEMTQWGMPLDRKFRVHGKDHTFLDFVEHAKMRASLKATPKQELSWTVLVLGQYLGTDTVWVNEAGETLRLADLLRYELDEPMDKAACGGTHRLFDLSWVHHVHLARGGKTEGIWKDVAANTVRYQQLAKKLQNADGSFSTDFFNGPGKDTTAERRINTSGHILEWLALSLSDAQLREPWVEEAANAVALMILASRNDSVEGGTLYHAAHGLLIYHARVFDRSKLTSGAVPIPLPPG